MRKTKSLAVVSLTHTSHLVYNELAVRKAEDAATLSVLDKDFRAQQVVWRGRSLHTSLLQEERARTQAALAEAELGPPIDGDGAAKGKVKKGKPKGEARWLRGTSVDGLGLSGPPG